eukprot:TRINITY_DN1961_c0_g1_i4.p1 TRINITY_DN1961_c0_g1~~TRINITY_DN1961_c0_g1_i4.p1  ORF type:complete len:239 (+),score=58.16 TRINITY_DN1961_c0_g1_i4:73-789(+)
MEPHADAAVLKTSSILAKSMEITQPEPTPTDKSTELQTTITSQKLRILDLEAALADARKLLTEREELLSHLQWKPKDDFYELKSSSNTIPVREHQEKKLSQLLEQMHVMEKFAQDKDEEINVLSESIDLAISNGGIVQDGAGVASPKYSTRSPAKNPLWSRSPTASPMSSPKPKSKWWFGRKDSMASSSGLSSSSSSNVSLLVSLPPSILQGNTLIPSLLCIIVHSLIRFLFSYLNIR